SRPPRLLRFVLHATVTTAIYTLSLHDALPIFFRSSFSTSISVRSVSFRMSASRRTSSASMPLSFFSLGAVFGSAIGASCPCLNRTVRGPAAFLRQAEGGLDRQFVTQRAEARNHAGGHRRHIGAMPEALARRRIGEVALDHRDGQRPQRVEQRHGGVAVARRVKDQGV